MTEERKSIADELIELGKTIPPEELAKLPCDGSSDPDRQKELRTLQEIVSGFALNGPYHGDWESDMDHTWCQCEFCSATFGVEDDLSETDQHEPSCLWRRAEELRRKYKTYWRANREDAMTEKLESGIDEMIKRRGESAGKVEKERNMTGIPNDEAVRRQTNPDEPTRIVILNERKGVTVTAWVGRRRTSVKVFPFVCLAELLAEVERLAKTCGMKRQGLLRRLWMGRSMAREIRKSEIYAMAWDCARPTKPCPDVSPPPQNEKPKGESQDENPCP